jgi:hypothetical protein
VRGASLANHRHRRSDRSRAVLPAVACRGATSRSAPATPSSLRRRAAAHRAGLGRRPVRGVRSEEGKSDLKALRAPSLRIRHRRTGQLVTDTIPGCRSEHPKRRRLRQHHRRRIRFSTPTNPGAPAAPARWGGNREPIPDRLVSRRYEHVENALAWAAESDRRWLTGWLAFVQSLVSSCRHAAWE